MCSLFGYLYVVKMQVARRDCEVKRNLYDVKIRPYKALNGKKGSDNPISYPKARRPGRNGYSGQGAAGAATRRRQ
jgi:hypothetical protein